MVQGCSLLQIYVEIFFCSFSGRFYHVMSHSGDRRACELHQAWTEQKIALKQKAFGNPAGF